MSDALLAAAEKRGVTCPASPSTPAAWGELAASVYLHPMRSGRKMPRELGYLEEAERRVVNTGEGEIVTWTWGAAGHPRVVLLHGWEGHGAQLGAFVGPLLAAGFHVVTFDAPGHGESAGEECSAPQMGRIVLELAREGGAFHSLVAHSMGCAAAAMAALHGERPQGMVFLAPPLSQLDRMQRLVQRLQLSGPVTEAFYAAVERRTGLSLREADMYFVAERAPCPLLAMHDPDDLEADFSATAGFVAAWRGATLVPCPGRGHYRLLSTPDVVRQGVAFVAALT